MFEKPQLLARMASAPLQPVKADYRLADFSTFDGEIAPSRFYEPSYDSTLLDMIAHVLAAEAPVSEGLLIQRIARVHHFQRSGRIIRERVMALAKRHHHVGLGHGDGGFVWPSEAMRREWCCYRLPTSADNIRQIEDIAPEELRAAAVTCRSGDRETEIARMFGIQRLSNTARQRIVSSL